PNCSGTLYYDIHDQILKCRHCSSTFDVEDYDKDNTAKLSRFGSEKVYTCKNCGARLITGDDEAVLYCNYCGSEQFLEGSLEGINEPKQIIPFRITKTECKKIYRRELKNKLYVPKEFKDPKFIDRFRPFYIPYWMYRVMFRNDELELKGKRSYTKGDYDYVEDYVVKTSIKNDGLYGVPYDASRNFDDSIAEKIGPFKKDGLRDYREGYLAGMYADIPNVSADTYKDEVLDKATVLAIEDIEKGCGGIDLKFPRGIRKQREFLDARYEGEEMIYLPVWFLTWRHEDRVAYAVVNGQSGKIHIDLPADISEFMKYTAMAALVIFVLLTLFVTVTSRFTLWFSALLAYLAGRRYRYELKRIRDRENHVYDKGYLLQDEDDLTMSEKKRTRIREHDRKGAYVYVIRFIIMSIIVFFVATILFGLFDVLLTQAGAVAVCTVVGFLEIISYFRTLSSAVWLKNKCSIFFSTLTLVSVIAGFIIAVRAPVDDWWYYLGALIALAAAALMCTDLLLRFNETSTRPLPSFYERKGGNDREEDLQTS
ncbi:MAG: DUF4040 domain-containing protein, partial [Erysipelotrichaceae bacterium]|nr:DUF4040 domain-containing protein [Erysipelotrichaceae bacterium]